MATSTESECSRILILGGTGFIGRNLVDYLVRNDLASKIRVVDKVPPQMGWMNARHSESFANPKVEFRHANLIHKSSVQKMFVCDDGGFDFVVNLAAETKYGQTDPVYKEGIEKLSLNCAEVAAQHQVKKFVELSTAQVYIGDKKPMTENSHLEPWTNVAKHKLNGERNLEGLASELNYVILRPAIVYGLGDRSGLTPRIIIGSIYRYICQKMRMLWNKELHMSTVHVDDCARALWHVCLHANHGDIYNLADLGNTTQGELSSLISAMFGINYDFLGSTLSNLARVRMTDVVEDINEKHMRPWSDACQRDGITNTPLTPFIHQELLYNKHLNIDGSSITHKLGFQYSKPRIELGYLQEIVEDFTKLKLLPASLVGGDTFYTPRHPDDMIEDIDLGGHGDEGDQVDSEDELAS